MPPRRSWRMYVCVWMDPESAQLCTAYSLWRSWPRDGKDEVVVGCHANSISCLWVCLAVISLNAFSDGIFKHKTIMT